MTLIDTFIQSVLEREAAVLEDPQNAEAWYNLGIKQQANEREAKAIQALRKAVELDPSMLAAWMELAVSHTNNGNKVEAYNSMSEWIDRNPKYTDIVAKWKQSQGLQFPLAVESLINCLVMMARTLPNDELDADIQIALGVLLNTTEVRAAASTKVIAYASLLRNTTKLEIVSWLRWTSGRPTICYTTVSERPLPIMGKQKKQYHIITVHWP